METKTRIRLQLNITIEIIVGGLDSALTEVAEILCFDSYSKLERVAASVPGTFAEVTFSRKVTMNGNDYRLGINHFADGVSSTTRIFLSELTDFPLPQRDDLITFTLDDASRLIQPKQLKNKFDNFFSTLGT
jgi:hypothetical protein